jgi:membrane associated rhomboid family serine protease
MTVAPVGIRCPEHAGKRPAGTPRAVRTVQRPLARRGIVVTGGALVTKILVAVNIVVYLITIAQGTGLNSPGGRLFTDWILFGPLVANGDWWRLITACFLHVSLWHIAFNMWALWWLGAVVESALGSWRFLLLYFVSGLCGSAGALIWDPGKPAAGASGAIFGILGAGLILEWRATGQLAGNFLTMIVLNLVITLAFSNLISAGGHVGGLIGGLLCTSVIMLRGRFRGFDVATIMALVAIGAASVAIAYWKVKGLA